MRVEVGRFEDEDIEIGAPEDQEPISWTAADEGDRLYDQMVEREMDRHAWPSNQDTFLLGCEDEMERARRRAPIREAA
jgi:hypothetical protein